MSLSSSNNEGGTLHLVEKFLINPNYNPPSFDYDIAVIRLTQPIKFGENARPIALFNADEEIKDGENVTVTGWGGTQPGGGVPSAILQMVTVPKWNDEECKKVYVPHITSRMICAGDTLKGSCDGDSGGPLVYNNKLAGVVNASHKKCTIENSPGVFAKVSAHRTWLDQAIASLKAEKSATLRSSEDNDVRVVGGQSIDISQAPHQVSLLFKGSHDCGGSIIDKNVIVTAAHCLSSSNKKDYQIRVGSSSSKEGGTLHIVQKFLINPSYNPQTFDNDIAVIWLSQPIQYGANAKPIDLFNVGEEVKDRENVIVTGWGVTRPGEGSSPTNLQMVTVPKWNDNECKKAYANLNDAVTSRMICAGDTLKGSCSGDSGGPLVYNNKLAGVVSWGYKMCTTENYPGVFAKVSALRTWLDQAIASLKAEGSAPLPSSEDDDVRIVAGQSIDISQAPHQVSLSFGGRHICGGSIIDKNLIVTAAHCRMSLNPKDHLIRVGSSSSNEGGTIHSVQKFLNHPSYNPKNFDNDIAVIWLSQPIQYGANARSIALLNVGEEIRDRENVIVTGWGDTRPGGQGVAPPILQMVTLTKWNDAECKKAYISPVTSRMICAGENLKGACKGDSGGPLVYNNRLAGVVSWGSKLCTMNGAPGVFAKVSALRTWLDQAIASLKAEASVTLSSSEDDVRIVGGEDIDITRAPHMASLVLRGNQICGASIIDKNLIVTAAHCLSAIDFTVTAGDSIGTKLKELQIRTGSATMNYGGTLHPVKKIVVHPKYNHIVDYDIALILISKPIQFGDNTKPIPLLGDGEEIKDGEITTVTGFGRLLGDGGGPLVYNNKLAGVVSWGSEDCAKEDQPRVFTKISVLRKWLDETMVSLKQQEFEEEDYRNQKE